MSDDPKKYQEEQVDLSNHFEYGPVEGFEEKGYTFKGWQPANDQARPVMVVQAFNKQSHLVAERTSKMNHPNIFGVDVEDVAEFDKVTDDLIKELGGD